MGKKILKEDKKRIELDDSSLKKKHNPMFIFFALTPVFVSVLSYFYFVLFWEQGRLIFDILPQFMQDFGIIRTSVDILASEGRINIANNFVISYYFGLFFMITFMLLATRYNFFPYYKYAKKRKTNMQALLIFFVMLILTYLLLFDNSIFAARGTRLSGVIRIELFGIAFYSAFIGIVTAAFVVAIQVIRFNTKGATNVK